MEFVLLFIYAALFVLAVAIAVAPLVIIGKLNKIIKQMQDNAMIASAEARKQKERDERILMSLNRIGDILRGSVQ